MGRGVIRPNIEVVLDTSVVLAVLKKEEASEVARSRLSNAAISVVNLAEVATKLTEWNVPPSRISDALVELDLAMLPFDEQLAVETGLLHQITRGRNISLGDRACLVTARRLGVPAVTADRAWADLDLGIVIELIR